MTAGVQGFSSLRCRPLKIETLSWVVLLLVRPASGPSKREPLTFGWIHIWPWEHFWALEELWAQGQSPQMAKHVHFAYRNISISMVERSKWHRTGGHDKQFWAGLTCWAMYFMTMTSAIRQRTDRKQHPEAFKSRSEIESSNRQAPRPKVFYELRSYSLTPMRMKTIRMMSTGMRINMHSAGVYSYRYS